jgi:lactose/L-arabinose transport system substrate-binding protein
MISLEPGDTGVIDTMMSSAGQWYFKDDATPFMVGNAALKEAASTLIRMRDAGIVLDVSSWDEYIGSLNNGTVVGTIQGIWIVGSIRAQDNQAGNWGMAKTPKLNISGASTAGTAGGSSWYVFSASKNQDAAIDFLAKTFGSNIDFYNEILPSTGAVATYTPAAQAPNYSAPQEFFGGQPIFADILEQAALIPRFDYGTFVYEARDAMRDFLGPIRNPGDIDSALASAEAQTISQMQ